MGILRESFGNPMEILRESKVWIHCSPVGFLWESIGNPEEIPWESYESGMGILRVPYRNPFRILPESMKIPRIFIWVSQTYNGHPTEMQLTFSGKSWRILWESIWILEGIQWKSYDNRTKKLGAFYIGFSWPCESYGNSVKILWKFCTGALWEDMEIPWESSENGNGILKAL